MQRGVAQRIIRVKSWKELPDTLTPGVIYEFDGVKIKPRLKMTREEARSLARGVKEMAGEA